MTALAILCVAIVCVAIALQAAFQRGYALGERHGRETERTVARWQDASPSLTVEELDRLRVAVFGANGTRAQAMEHLR